MEGVNLRAVVVMVAVAATASLLVGQSEAAGSFKDCYIKCYIFCMIEPNQTLCSCTTQCFKDCIFPGPTSSLASQHVTDGAHAANNNRQNFGFCKFGCASSLCSNISTHKNPNGESVDSCVGSCSRKCATTYSSSSSFP